MKLIYTGESIREAEKPYVQAPDYNGYLMPKKHTIPSLATGRRRTAGVCCCW